MTRQNTHATVDLLKLSSQLKALADPRRLLIFNLLMEGVQCNCELGDKLGMAPNLISHHLGVLRQAGLVDIQRDALDARWIYYSINRAALEHLHAGFSSFFDVARIQPRDPACGPSGCGAYASTSTSTISGISRTPEAVTAGG